MIDYLSANPAVVAVIFTAVGGIILKILEKWLGRKADRRDDRKEFREEWNELLTRIDRLEAEVDAWRDKYYRGQEQILTLKAMIIGAGIQVPDDLSTLDDL